MNKSSEWRKNNHLTQEELEVFVKNVNENMRRYNEDIKKRIEQSDKAELNMYKVKHESSIDEDIGKF